MPPGVDDVAREVNEKLIRRHPHVFGDSVRLGTASDVIVKWEEIKAQENAGKVSASKGIFKDMPARLPALMFAEAVWKQIEKRKLPVAGAVDVAAIRRLESELDEETLGRRLFELAAAARARGLDPEGSLRLHATRVMRDVEDRTHSPAFA